LVCWSCDADPLHLHSFPTRRSSDLPCAGSSPRSLIVGGSSSSSSTSRASFNDPWARPAGGSTTPTPGSCCSGASSKRSRGRSSRSEEHTSELQSRENLVCRLLLEKK